MRKEFCNYDIVWEKYASFCQPYSLDPSLEFRLYLLVLLELALKRSCARITQNEMFHLLFIYFQVTFWFTLGPNYTFVLSHLLFHFRIDLYFWNVYFKGFFITFSQGLPKMFQLGYFTHKELLHEFFLKLMTICISLLMLCRFSLLDLLHQCQPHSTISPFVNDGNHYTPLVIMLPLLTRFLPPFDINGKGNSP